MKKSIAMSRRTFFKATAVTGVAMTSSGLVYGNRIEPYNIDMTYLDIPLHGLAPEFENYKIVQITDLHTGSWLNRERLEHIVQIINKEEPDLVAITGDFISMGRIAPYVDDLVATLSQLQARDRVVAVLGNHDHWKNVEQTQAMLKSANILELPNESIILERNDSKLVIAGLDDVWESQHDIDKLVSTLPDEDTPVVLLAHEPDIADNISETGRFAFQMSGHSHGGQVRLPFIGAPILPKWGKKYPMGMYEVGDMLLYTNRGVGMADIPIRFGCPPEIAIFSLVAHPA